METSSTIKTTLRFSVVVMVLIFISSPLVLYALDTTYVPLAPLTEEQTKKPVRPSTYIADLFKITIGIAAALAVLAIAYSGIKYMMSDVVTSKEDAKKGIQNALLGLLLAITSYLILYTISPDFTQISIIRQFDQTPAPAAAPPKSSAIIVYRIEYSPYAYTLRYRKTEYELEYLSSTAGNPLYRERHENLAACNGAGDAAPKVGSYECKLVRQYLRPPARGIGAILLSGETYPTTADVTREWATIAQCLSDKATVPSIYTILLNCESIPSANTTTAERPTLDACKALLSTLQGQKFFIKEPGCFPVVK